MFFDSLSFKLISASLVVVLLSLLVSYSHICWTTPQTNNVKERFTALHESFPARSSAQTSRSRINCRDLFFSSWSNFLLRKLLKLYNIYQNYAWDSTEGVRKVLGSPAAARLQQHKETHGEFFWKDQSAANQDLLSLLIQSVYRSNCSQVRLQASWRRRLFVFQRRGQTRPGIKRALERRRFHALRLLQRNGRDEPAAAVFNPAPLKRFVRLWLILQTLPVFPETTYIKPQLLRRREILCY